MSHIRHHRHQHHHQNSTKTPTTNAIASAAAAPVVVVDLTSSSNDHSPTTTTTIAASSSSSSSTTTNRLPSVKRPHDKIHVSKSNTNSTGTSSIKQKNRVATQQQQQQQHTFVDLINSDEEIYEIDADVVMIPNEIAATTTTTAAASASVGTATAAASSAAMFRRRARKAYKVDPNEVSSPLLSDRVPLDTRILNIDPHKRKEVIGIDNDDGDDDDEVIEITKTIEAPDSVKQVLEVFPDADLVAIKIMLNERMDDAAAVVEYMSQHKYMKSEAALANQESQTLQLSVKDGPEWIYDYMSANSFIPTHSYCSQAADLLVCDFPFLSKAGAASSLQKCKYHYALSHHMLFEAVKGPSVDEDVQYMNVLQMHKKRRLPTDQQERIFHLLNDCRSPTMKTPTKRNKVLITDKILHNERQYVTSKVNEWMQNQMVRRERALKKKIAQESGTAVECACCFDSFPVMDVVQCNRNDVEHRFCLDCIKARTENLIFGDGNLGVDTTTKKLALELKCFHGDGCHAGFSRSILQQALPIKSLNKYDEIQCEINIQLAGLGTDELCSCPKCGFQANVPSGQNLFHCPVSHCRFISCRSCGDAAHIPLRCDEVQRDKKETEGRLTVEEAITRAKIRSCPTCKKGFVKESGCNKITCGCGTKICYICQKKISDYSHFCQTGLCDHKTCQKCPLHTNAEEDDKRAMLAAGIAAAEQVRQKMVGVDVVIDVNKIINAK